VSHGLFFLDRYAELSKIVGKTTWNKFRKTNVFKDLPDWSLTTWKLFCGKTIAIRAFKFMQAAKPGPYLLFVVTI